jgi:hypothetical protein
MFEPNRSAAELGSAATVSAISLGVDVVSVTEVLSSSDASAVASSADAGRTPTILARNRPGV